MDHNGLADPYVKLHLLPGASKVRRLFASPSLPGAAPFPWKSEPGGSEELLRSTGGCWSLPPAVEPPAWLALTQASRGERGQR